MRRLEVTKAGYWYLALTILLGVVALVSGNNIIYLVESLLLSGLILSGVLSEREVSGVEVEWVRSTARAQERSRDTLRITNRRKVALYCIEILEWKNRGELSPLVFVAHLEPLQTVTVRSNQFFDARGELTWKGLAIATSYPFGFARKMCLVTRPGRRLIWPAHQKKQNPRQAGDLIHRSRQRSTSDVSEGEIRPITQDDDLRQVVWTASAKGSELFVRPRQQESSMSESILDLRQANDIAFEECVRTTARAFYSNDRSTRDSHPHDAGATLTLIRRNGRQKIRGSRKSLDALATIRAEGGGK